MFWNFLTWCFFPFVPRQVDVCFKQHMACIVLTDMDPPISGPTAHLDGLLPDLDPAAGLDPKQETDATCLTVHLYNLGKDGGGENGSELQFPPGEYVAEELCINAAKACGESQEDFSSDVCPHTQNIVQFTHIK